MTGPRTCRACGVHLDRRTAGDLCRAHRMKARNADPAFNPLAALTPEERADYDLLKKRALYTRAEALRAIGRADLIPQPVEREGGEQLNMKEARRA